MLPFAALVLALGIAGCGTGSADRQESEISRQVASRLIAQSDSVARTIERGDDCAAARQAAALRSQVLRAIGAGQIPRALATEARRRTTRLVQSIVCVPAVEDEDDDDEDDDEERDDDGHDGDDGGDGDGGNGDSGPGGDG